VKIAILGAGVSGLALARFLVEGGVAPDAITLFEADSVAGGLCRSKTVDGFTYDIAGGHILFSKDTAAMQWMKDNAGGDEAWNVSGSICVWRSCGLPIRGSPTRR
jgi:protoporphyrinogen oxidase